MNRNGKTGAKPHRLPTAVAAGLTAVALFYSVCNTFGHLDGTGAMRNVGRLLEGFPSLIVPFVVYAVALALAIVSVRTRGSAAGMAVLSVAAIGCAFHFVLLALLLAMNM